MLTERAIYGTLSRKDLQDLVAHFDITVADRRVRDNLVQALAASRKVRLNDALTRLSVVSLKDICRAHALDDAGRQKAAFVERIVKAVKAKPAKKAAPKAEPKAKVAKTAKVAKAEPKAKVAKTAKVAKAEPKAKAAKAEPKAKVAKAAKAEPKAKVAKTAKAEPAKAEPKAKPAKDAAPVAAQKPPKKAKAPEPNLLARASALDAARVINDAAAPKAPAVPPVLKVEPKKPIALVPAPEAAPQEPAAVQAPAAAQTPLNPTRVLDWPENLPTPPMPHSEVAAPVFTPRASTQHCVACAQAIELRKCQVQRCNNHIMASPTYKICAECLFERNTLSMTDFNERLQEEGKCPHCGHAWKKAS